MRMEDILKSLEKDDGAQVYPNRGIFSEDFLDQFSYGRLKFLFREYMDQTDSVLNQDSDLVKVVKDFANLKANGVLSPVSEEKFTQEARSYALGMAARVARVEISKIHFDFLTKYGSKVCPEHRYLISNKLHALFNDPTINSWIEALDTLAEPKVKPSRFINFSSSEQDPEEYMDLSPSQPKKESTMDKNLFAISQEDLITVECTFQSPDTSKITSVYIYVADKALFLQPGDLVFVQGPKASWDSQPSFNQVSIVEVQAVHPELMIDPNESFEHKFIIGHAKIPSCNLFERRKEFYTAINAAYKKNVRAQVRAQVQDVLAGKVPAEILSLKD